MVSRIPVWPTQLENPLAKKKGLCRRQKYSQGDSYDWTTYNETTNFKKTMKLITKISSDEIRIRNLSIKNETNDWTCGNSSVNETQIAQLTKFKFTGHFGIGKNIIYESLRIYLIIVHHSRLLEALVTQNNSSNRCHFSRKVSIKRRRWLM